MSATLAGGFTNAVLDAQANFRAVLHAMSRPGSAVDLPLSAAPSERAVKDLGSDAAELGPGTLDAGTAALSLTLLDQDTPLWLTPSLDRPEVRQWLAFHCACPITDAPAQASFAILDHSTSTSALSALAIGSDEYPDRSATAIIQVQALAGGPPRAWSGPGIETEVAMQVSGLPCGFETWWDTNHALFPQGVDCIIANGRTILGLPRSTAWGS